MIGGLTLAAMGAGAALGVAKGIKKNIKAKKQAKADKKYLTTLSKTATNEYVGASINRE